MPAWVKGEDGRLTLIPERAETVRLSDPLNPPAVVRSVTDLKALAAKIKADYAAHMELLRRSLERAIAIGEALIEVKKIAATATGCPGWRSTPPSAASGPRTSCGWP